VGLKNILERIIGQNCVLDRVWNQGEVLVVRFKREKPIMSPVVIQILPDLLNQAQLQWRVVGEPLQGNKPLLQERVLVDYSHLRLVVR